MNSILALSIIGGAGIALITLGLLFAGRGLGLI